ncbi:MAG: S8 family serine peptidase [Verrucomicrobiales bacterium]|nr:S8 family serine peptidase [Verrucomicrobiales bacterium]
MRASASAVAGLADIAQAILPYEPYYKLKWPLLELAVKGEIPPSDTPLNVALFPDARDSTRAALKQLGADVLAEDRSPFGPVLQVRVRPEPDSLAALARLPGVQVIEPWRPRVGANDLSRVRLGIATDTITTTNHFNLTGTNVLVNVNDSGVDATHPDLASRVWGYTTLALSDSNGHGTHVAGVIASSGGQSPTVTNASGSINPGTNTQYRGKAPGARLFVVPIGLGARPFNDLGSVPSDTLLQEAPARTNAFISNNSWYYAGANAYDLHAASYDAAVRDALPERTGSQPVLFVFPAGNAGSGDDGGLGGEPDRIHSPGTAKNVITVGAIEQLRNITNVVVTDCVETNINGTNVTLCTTNIPWQGMTDANNQVASFSSRGNVGIGIEGDFGRFKPDLVAPGTFVISTRSTHWDQRQYYNPTNEVTTPFPGQSVGPTNLVSYFLFVPNNAVQLHLWLATTSSLPVFVRQAGPPTPSQYDALGTNSVSLPPDAPLSPRGVGWWCAVGNPSTESNALYDLFVRIVTTNDLGNYFEVLSNMNNQLGPFYRYESGTSLAAADVSGVLALMQELFEQRLQRTNSPALMKALLINGARSVQTPPYDLAVRSTINYQGWGLVRVRNTIARGLTNFALGQPSGIWMTDQSPTNALATGQSQTRRITATGFATNEVLRITLAWTDPPGNPVAGLKLVNDLDLIVTNRDTAQVFFGNDFPANSLFTQPWDTNGPPNRDAVNNVENVFLPPPFPTNGYDVTVLARRVHVNAVTAHTNDVVQDYALVIASGDGDLTNGLSVSEQPVFMPPPAPLVDLITSNLFETSDVAGTLLLGQRVGANTPLLGTTNGMTNQWHFYVITNTTTFTNAAFVTFTPPTLALPRMGTREHTNENATRLEADIDLYVSQDPSLTNLNPAAIAAATKSRGRGGTEVVALSNATQNAVYYIGVKSEDYQAAEYGLVVAFSLRPFSERENGNLIVRGFPVPTATVDGNPAAPGATFLFGLALEPMKIRRVVVTNSIVHDAFDDLFGNLSHNNRFAVLNNHRPLNPGAYQFIYEDNGEGNPPNAIPTDGPGSLRDFVGEEAAGVWLLTMLDNVLNASTGAVTGFSLRIEPRDLDSASTNTRTLAPNTWTYDSIDVPVEATNLTVTVSFIAPSAGPLNLYLRKGDFPTTNVYDKALTGIVAPGGSLSITRFDLPPLSAGRWFIGVYNPGPAAQTFRLFATLGLDIAGVTPLNRVSVGNEPLRDDAVTYSSLWVTNVPNPSRIVSVEVGLRVDHPRVSDLAFTLVAPDGTRVLLMENRGRTNEAGIGSSTFVTNVVPVTVSNSGPQAVTNVIPMGMNAGSFTVDYNFFDVPDRMTIYYENTRLLDTGFINGTGQFNLSFGPGTATDIVIVMNEGGNPNPITAYRYTVSSVQTNHTYLIFTEDTRRTTTPIKFATPPFAATGPGGPVTVTISTFDPATPGEYAVPSLVDGWAVGGGQVSVVNDPTTALSSNFLALAAGTITRNLPTTPGRTYTLRFHTRGPGIVSWWRGENSALDEADGNHGILVGDTTYGPGVVGQAFVFDGFADRVHLGNPPNLQIQNFTLEAWVRRSSTTDISFDDNTGGVGEGGEIIMYGAGGYGIGLTDDGRIFLTRVQFDHTMVGPTITDTAWHHLACTKSGSTVWFFVDGVRLPAPVPTPYNAVFSFTTPIAIGARGDGPGTFYGRIDEPSIYRRALSASEISAIYNAGAAGKFDPAAPAPQNLAKARVSIGNLLTNVFYADNTNWQMIALTFVATQTNTPLRLEGLTPGMLLDNFTLSDVTPSAVYYLPEESLEKLTGKNAWGEWRLEVWDSRTGASNLVSLVSWQLSFIFENVAPLPRALTDGLSYSNSIPPGLIAWFVVDVPPGTSFATNRLLTASAPLNLWFNQNAAPTGTNFGDALLFGPVTSASRVLVTNGVPPFGPPPLLPGQRYYLGLQNPGTTTATYALRVDFDHPLVIIPLVNGVPYFNTNSATAGTNDYYRYTVTSNALRAHFEILSPGADVTLVARKGLPLPGDTSFDYRSANPGTSDELIVLFTNSTPVGLSPGDWYLTAVNVSGGPVTYAIRATEWPLTGRPIYITAATATSNAFCLTWTSLPGVRYTVQGLTNLNSTNWLNASPPVTAADYTSSWCIPLPSPLQFFRIAE